MPSTTVASSREDVHLKIPLAAKPPAIIDLDIMINSLSYVITLQSLSNFLAAVQFARSILSNAVE
jgi:hypothetical protein